MYKAIKGYEGFYEVNELGQIRSVNRIVECKDGRIRKYKGRDLKIQIDKDGYANIVLQKNGVYKNYKVHRLVAEAFLPNPDSLLEIHHLNHDRKDNRAHNLAWVSRSEQRDDHWRAAKGTKLRVVGHGIDKIFISAKAVQRELGVSNTYVLDTAKVKFKQAKGYKIYFANQETETNNA